ncbi:uncharacterized protein EI90DRAFT_3129932 [Cantharellus anzutake]|uniref:uncharacterized protein n=1 Tax=Cantharellus anzutake TaxID=1750568 RepID=UPI00190766C4|nr:uncharacterized protein EI90DRAFT_3129932 [Cantharellus anzutake]KAF8324467.1 hypothetical protein EI90DRAFT_3129932 [Cantharellus anzutake]
MPPLTNGDDENGSSFPRTPSSSSLVNLTSYFNKAFDKDTDDWPGLTLLDTVETFFDARIDLFERNLKKQKDRFQLRAKALAKQKIRPNTEELDKELQKFKTKVSKRLADLSEAWHSTKVVRTRDKLSFFFGVMNVMGTSLLFGLAPEWLHVVYTIQAVICIPFRFYQYRKKAGLGILLGRSLLLCESSLPAVPLGLSQQRGTLHGLLLSHPWLFSDLLRSHHQITHLPFSGSLATAVITWRNSLVFHDYDKMVSMFIHIYPPLVFSTIRHFERGRIPDSRFPAVHKLNRMQPVRALVFSSVFYILWQGLYWKFLLVDRKEKIASGQRTTSLTWLLNDKHGPIGRMLRGVRPEFREGAQFVYSIITELPAIFILYDSATWSGVFLMFIFAVSVWNGGGFYIEVFGRKFERELEALRKEIAQSSQIQPNLSMPSPSTPASSLPGSPQVVVSENHEDFRDEEDGSLDFVQANVHTVITNNVNTSLVKPRVFVVASDSTAPALRDLNLQDSSMNEESRKDK